MFCDEAGEDPDQPWGGDDGRAPAALDALRAAGPSRGRWAVLVGPEGGFAPEERRALRAHEATLAVSLGPRILRADTAAIAALALFQSACGDWRPPQER
jgi:16S rRNA (uracil1498-N3)-methyltransferase